MWESIHSFYVLTQTHYQTSHPSSHYTLPTHHRWCDRPCWIFWLHNDHLLAFWPTQPHNCSSLPPIHVTHSHIPPAATYDSLVVQSVPRLAFCWACVSKFLFCTFTGKRFNVLRNRIDSWNYDVDQLLLGTILFTLLAFLFPTVLSYYALFALVCTETFFIYWRLRPFL